MASVMNAMELSRLCMVHTSSRNLRIGGGATRNRIVDGEEHVKDLLEAGQAPTGNQE